jgi:NAD(P)H-flavin reductase
VEEKTNPYLPMPAQIKSINWENYETFTFTLQLSDQKRFTFQPGQFNLISVLGVGEAPFSISSAPRKDGSFDHTVRIVGNVTKALSRLSVGDLIGVRGPYGNGWPLKKVKGKNLVIVAGGLGLAPLVSVIEYVIQNRHQFGDLEIFYGARSPNDLIFTRKFEEWQRAARTRLFLTVDRIPANIEWPYRVGVVTSLFELSSVEPAKSLVFTCGPEIMMHFVGHAMLTRGFQDNQIFISMERRMECGIGKCGHCLIGSKYVCQNGPVFSLQEIRLLPHNLLAEVAKRAV